MSELVTPECFSLEGERSRETEASAAGIFGRETEPSGVGGQTPGFDGSSPDDNEVEDDSAEAVGDDV